MYRQKFAGLMLMIVMMVGIWGQAPLTVRANEVSPSAPIHTAQSGCPVDLMLVLDGSGSIAPSDFEVMKDFVRDFIASFPIGERGANIGLIQFSTTAELYLSLSDDTADVNASINNMTQFGASTNIAAAIDLAQNQFVVRRAGIPRVMIVLTDGLHNESGNPIVSADRARVAGTAVFGVAVGGFDFEEISRISGGDENVILVSAYNGLKIVMDLLLNNACSVVVVPQPGEENLEIGTVIKGGDNTVQFEVTLPEAGDTQIVFASNRDGDFEIFVMDADGENVRQLTFNSVNDDKPAWSKDGTRIAWESEINGKYQIFVMDADGSNIQQLTTADANHWGPAWSPDSSKLAFHSDADGDIEIYVMNANGTGLQQVTFNSGATDRSPSWSPDGYEVIYYSDVTGGRELFRADVAGQYAPVRLSNNSFYDGQPDWSLNGLGVVFGSTSEDNNSEIYIMRVDGSNVVRMTDRPGTDDDPVWSPDGRQIAMESDAAGNFDIWVMNTDGTGLVQLTDNPATDWSPDWMWVAGTLSPQAGQ